MTSTVSLALGSGGARGFAHFGVIRWLTEHGYEISSISGCSVGAITGGIFACGKVEEFLGWFREISVLEAVHLADPSIGRGGLFSGDRFFDSLREIVCDVQIEDLPIGYTAIALDLEKQNEVWLAEGSLVNAMQASTALPLLFSPHTIDGTELLDGGILNPIPIAPTLKNSSAFSIAVNLSGTAQFKRKDGAESLSPRNADGEILTKYFGNLVDASDDGSRDDWGMTGIANRAYETMQGVIAAQALAAYPPDKTIVISKDACGFLDFDRADEMIELGYSAAELSLGAHG